MKTMKYILVVAMAVLTVLSGCKKEFLDKEPLGQQTDQNFYNIESNAILAVNACYDPLSWDEGPGANHNYEFMFGDVLSDDAEKGSMPSDFPELTEMKEWRTTATNSVTSGLWNNVYKGIFRCNSVLLNLPDATIDEEIKNRLIGEASFLRAYYYFYLVRVFGGVPVFDKPVNPSQFGTTARASISDVYKLIEADLTRAAELLPQKSQYAINDMGRATKGAALAYKARATMYQIGTDNTNGKSWQEVFDLTNEIIASGEYMLVENYATIFEMEGENNAESVFEIQCASNNTGWGPGKTGTTSIVFQGPRTSYGWGFNNPTQHLWDSFEDNDPRRASAIYGDGDIVHGEQISIDLAENQTGYLNRKAHLEPAFRPSDSKDSPVNLRKFRFSDILLMNAEAAFYLGNESQAREKLNQVRARAKQSTKPKGTTEGGSSYEPIPSGLLDGVLEPISASVSGNALLQAIWNERRWELSMESLRFWDLVRTGQYLNSLPEMVRSNCQTHIINGVNPIPVLPIPLNEAQTWNLEQNPGY
jgi:starch-binding outer membrane protein, SusD/RagB family